jgi:hypothetical protein
MPATPYVCLMDEQQKQHAIKKTLMILVINSIISFALLLTVLLGMPNSPLRGILAGVIIVYNFVFTRVLKSKMNKVTKD